MAEKSTASEKTMSVFNKGQRTFHTKSGPIRPEETVSVALSEGQRLTKSYPRELVNLDAKKAKK